MSGLTPTLTKNFTAGGAITKRRIVTIGAADGQVIQATGFTAALLGVAAELDVASGGRVDVHMDGIVEVEAGAAIARGAEVTADSLGRAVEAALAGTGVFIVGYALAAATAAGDVIPVLVRGGAVRSPGAVIVRTAGATVNINRMAKFHSTAGQVVQAAAATDAIIGVALNTASSGQPCAVQVSGIVRAVCASGITEGTVVTSDANGRAVAAAPSAGVNNRVLGVALETVASGVATFDCTVTPNLIQGA